MQFIFTLTDTDYMQFAQFRNRLTKSGFMVYLLCAGMLVLSFYETFETKNYMYVGTTGALVLLIAAVQLYSLYIAPKRQFKKRVMQDALYTGENRVRIDESTVSVRLGQADGNTIVDAVYPYCVISAVFETAEAIYFFISAAEIQMLPKRAIPDGQRDAVTAILKKLANYRFVK